jgi:undecaprenyl-diphosphatase
MSLLMQWNDALFQVRNSYVGAYLLLDGLMVWCANALIFCFLLMMLLMWGRPLNWRKQQLSAGEQEILRERRAAVLWVAIACLAADAFNMVVEHLMFEPCPFISQHVHLLISHVADDSFPSDHTAWAIAVGGMFVLHWRFCPWCTLALVGRGPGTVPPPILHAGQRR